MFAEMLFKATRHLQILSLPKEIYSNEIPLNTSDNREIIARIKRLGSNAWTVLPPEGMASPEGMPSAEGLLYEVVDLRRR